MEQFIIHEEEIGDLVIKIIQDDHVGIDPITDWEMLGTQMYWHRRMNLGHGWKETNKYSPEEWLQSEVVSNCWKHLEQDKKYKAWAKIQEEKNYDADVDTYIENEMSRQDLWEAFEKYNLVIPVHAYEHGGITISASGRRAGWDSFDSGQLGFVYVSHADILKEYSKKRITKKLLEQAEKVLLAEVSEYDDYLNGNVWGYTIEDKEGFEEYGSCWGFIGDYKYCLEEAKSEAKFYQEKIDKERKLEDERMK